MRIRKEKRRSSSIVTDNIEIEFPPASIVHNPAYEPSSESEDDVPVLHPTISNPTGSSNSTLSIQDEDESSVSWCQGSSSTTTTTNPIESLRKLTREISPGITLTPIQKESMSDPEFTSSFPVIISRQNSIDGVKIVSDRRRSRTSEYYYPESYWDFSLPGTANQKRTSLLFRSRQAYNDEIFDIDSVLNLKPKYFGFTQKQWTTLCVFAFVNIFSAIVVNLQAPFYPEIAQRKGATELEIGIIFGSFEFIVFCLSPFFGKWMDVLGPKRVFNIGIIITGTCSILFGFLTFLENRILFVVFSLVLRIIEAAGSAGHVTATFTLIAVEFPDSIFTVFASMETCSGVGLILGPLLGSLLYGLGSTFGLHFQFLLPFLTLGGILFSGALMAYFIMPNPPKPSTNSKNSIQNPPEEKQGLVNLFRVQSVPLAAFSIFATAVSLGYHSSSLEPHVRQFELDSLKKGALFVINGGTYAILAPLIGRICDRTANPTIIILMGGLLIFGGYILVGPAPFLPFETILWVTCLGLFVQGIGLACSFVAAFTQAMRGALESGFPDSVSTYGLVSGLWMSMFSLGNCVGPIGAGILTHMKDYRFGTVFVMILQLLVVGFSMILLWRSRSNVPTSNVSNPDSELGLHNGDGIVGLRNTKFYSEFGTTKPKISHDEILDKIKVEPEVGPVSIIRMKGFDDEQEDQRIHRL